MTTTSASPHMNAPSGQALVVDAAHVDVTYTVRGADRLAIRDVSFQIGRQESFGLVGESGCGKTTMALAITRYLARNGRVSSGSISVNGQDISSLGKDALRSLRARTVSMVYQEPGRARRGCPAPGADLRPGPGAPLLSAPAVRRDAAAGRHRDGPRRGTGPAHPGRTDHGAGRHRRGGDSRSRRVAAR